MTLAAGITGNPKADTVLLIVLAVVALFALAGSSNK